MEIIYQLSCLGLDDDVEHLKQKTPLSVGSTAILYHVLLAETYVKMPSRKTEKLETERKPITNCRRNPELKKCDLRKVKTRLSKMLILDFKTLTVKSLYCMVTYLIVKIYKAKMAFLLCPHLNPYFLYDIHTRIICMP